MFYMTRKLLILFLLFGLILSNVSAILMPDLIDIDYIVNEKKTGNFSVFYDYNTTQHNFTIYNITVEGIPYTNFTMIPSLDINKSALIYYNINIEEPYVGDDQGKLIYYYFTNITRQPRNVSIKVNSTGFHPVNTTIYQNDTIIWESVDPVNNHTVTNLDNPEDRILLPPWSRYFQNYPDKSVINFYDEYTSIGGQLIIKDNIVEAYTHTPGYDMPITFSFNFLSTDIEADVIPDNFTMDRNEEDSGVLRLKSQIKIFNLHLEGDWFTFETNNFDLEGTELIEFTIDPKNITLTSETNMTYNKEIRITGDNIYSTTITIPIFINFANLTDEEEEDVLMVYRTMTLKQQRQFCEDIDWEDSTCQKYLKNDTYPVYVERKIRPELNESDFIAFIDAPDDIIESNDRVKSKIEESDSSTSTRLDNIESRMTTYEKSLGILTDNINIVTDYVLNLKKNKIFSSVLFWIIVFILVITLGIFLLIRYIKSRRHVTTKLGF